MKYRPRGPSHQMLLALSSAVVVAFVLCGQNGFIAGSAAYARSATSGNTTLAAASGVDVQTIQRLLNQLSVGDPKRYGAVDPGTTNGVFNQRTRKAIENFMRIKGIKGPPKINRDLWSQLIAAQLDLPPMETGVRRLESTGQCGFGVPASACAASAGAGTPGPAAAAPVPLLPDDRGATATTATVQQVSRTETAAPADRRGAGIPAIRFQKGRGRSFYIQLASLDSESAARNKWRKVTRANAAILKKADAAIEKATPKGDRVYYRLLIGPYQDLPEARHVCSTLKRNKQSCFVHTSRGRAVLMDRAVAERSDRVSAVVASDRLPAPPPAQPRRRVVSEPLAPIPLPKPLAAAPSRAEIGQNGDASSQRLTALAQPSREGAARQETQPADAGRYPAATPGESESGSPVAALSAEPGAAAAIRDSTADTASDAPRSASGDTDFVAVLSKGVVVVPERGDDAGGLSPIVGRRWFDVVFGRVKLFFTGWGGVALALLFGAWTIYSYRRSRRRSALNSAFAEALNEAEDMEKSGHSTADGDAVTEILRSFDSDQLRESRNARDIFLQDVFEVTSVTAVPEETEGSAMLVNNCLKDLLSSEPSKYKLIFLNWVFLNQVGVALNRRELLIEQLDRAIGREVDLVRSYFKIHLLELDHRHRLCDRLPGLFYCLQKSES